MLKICVFLTSLLAFKFSCGSMLLWAQQSIQIPTLKHFHDIDLVKLIQELNYPKIVAFQSGSSKLFQNASDCFNDMHSAYAPNGEVNLKEIEVIDEQNEDDVKVIEEAICQCRKNEKNILFLLVLPHGRSKREVGNSSNETPSVESIYEIPKGPVLYNARGTAMIYSARPPLLKTNSSNLVLGKSVTAILTGPDRSTPQKLIVTIPVVDGKKVTLRFRFPWFNGYWSLTTVELVDIDGKTYYLNISTVVGAPRHFSYHCFGETIFRDTVNNVELILYTLQAQPDSKNNRFNDALDCVPFMTVPILSGLFIMFLLIMGLIIGLSALGSIKSMDKFDNCRTKQLSIALAD